MTDSIELKGFKEAVAKYKAIVQKQIEIDEITTEASSEICRYLKVFKFDFVFGTFFLR